MSALAILFMLSAVVGFALGVSYNWYAIAVSGIALAVLSAAVLHNQGFGSFSGIAIIVACLTISQASYLAGVRFARRRRSENSIQQQADNDPRRRRNHRIGHQ
jgi:signal transduction histidine kinase